MQSDQNNLAMTLRFNKSAFYRACRIWHSYLSAAAFLMLIFFSVSGILLNHPDWFASRDGSASEPVTVTLNPSKLENAMNAESPGPALAGLIKENANVIGTFDSADISDFEVALRFNGVKGDTLVLIDLATATVEVDAEPASVISIIHDLHRGKDAGPVWKAIIDISALVILVMSVAGFILFLTLRLRFADTMKLIAGSLITLSLIFVLFTP